MTQVFLMQATAAQQKCLASAKRSEAKLLTSFCYSFSIGQKEEVDTFITLCYTREKEKNMRTKLPITEVEVGITGTLHQR